jgi:hypothetical protein
MYEALKNGDGSLSVAGHRIDPRTLRCTNLRDGNACNRHINDILSDASEAKKGQVGIACYGGLTEHELETLQKAAEVRQLAFTRALA